MTEQPSRRRWRVRWSTPVSRGVEAFLLGLLFAVMGSLVSDGVFDHDNGNLIRGVAGLILVSGLYYLTVVRR